MVASAKKLAERFIGEAMQLPPEARPQYFRKVAVGFSRLAADPKNIHAKKGLTKIGLEFAGAAVTASKQHTMTDFQYLLESTRDAVEQLDNHGYYPGAAMDVLAIRGAGGSSGGEGVSPGVGGGGSRGDLPKTLNTPPSWNANTTLGRQVTVKYAPTAEEIMQGVKQQETAAFWQGDKTEAQAMTVDIGVVIPPLAEITPSATIAVVSRPFASIDFGSDGTRSTVVLDVGTGRRVTVIGNYISVNLGMDPPPSPVGPVTFVSATMSIGASIAAFGAASPSPAIRTEYFDHIAANLFTGGRPLPAKAAFLRTPNVVQTLSQPQILVAFFDLSGNPVGEWTYNVAGVPQPPDMAAIPGDAFYFAISQGVALGAARSVRVPFQLSL
jgi:hypothetical protein